MEVAGRGEIGVPYVMVGVWELGGFGVGELGAEVYCGSGKSEIRAVNCMGSSSRCVGIVCVVSRGSNIRQ